MGVMIIHTEGRYYRRLLCSSPLRAYVQCRDVLRQECSPARQRLFIAASSPRRQTLQVLLTSTSSLLLTRENVQLRLQPQSRE
ncbi:hypothetical protein Q5P01_005863 [Channa striata]|uniref:Uncharacterized protein n=1 Tax=Channa striata TaxID=64152 RepID=A0AA88NDB7_CHASR|nr:hypothetical protein Q5P01_005863 [Channa striata]